MFIFSFLKLGFDFIAGRAIALFNMRMQIATFIIDRWRVFLVLAILALGAIHYFSLRHTVSVAKSELIVAKKALIDHVNADNEAAKKREAENRLNKKLAQKKTEARKLEHQQEISQILLKGKSNETITFRTITNMRSELRHKIEGYEAKRLLENDTSGIAERNSNATILGQLQETQSELAVCKEAGAIAASDYNLCKSYVDVQQSILGVDE